MSLRIRRGLEADRLSVTPDEGELLWITDTSMFYVGDGSTPGGILVGGGGGGIGDVVGPGVSVNGDIVQFDGTTGKLIKDGGKSISTDGTLASNSDNKISTEKAVKTYADTKEPLIGFTPENVANKTDTVAGNTASSTKYLSVKGYFDWLLQGLTQALSSKTTPIDADFVLIEDSADSNKTKKTTWANVKATLKTYFDSLYQGTGLALLKANNLSDVSSSATSRANLGVDKRTTHGDSDFSIAATDKEVVTSATLSASRNWTLPDASTVNAGYEIIIADEAQGITATNTLVVKVQTGQKLNGVINGTETMQSAGGWQRLTSNGTDGWFFDLGITRANNTQTLTNKTMSGASNTFTNIDASTSFTNATPIANGGTGATTAAGARTNLGLDTRLVAQYLWASSQTTTIADSTTYRIATIPNIILASSDSLNNEISSEFAGTIKTVRINWNMTPGTNEGTTLRIKNLTSGSTFDFSTSLDFSVGTGAQNFSGGTLAVSAGDKLQALIITPIYATNPANASVAVSIGIYL